GIFNEQHEGIRFIKLAITQRLRPLAEEGLEWIIISGQLGVELWTAEAVYDLQDEFPTLQVAVLTPFLEQDKRWQAKTKAYYDNIHHKEDFVDSITKRPYENPSQLKLKNDFIIAKSDGLLLLYDEDMPGTPSYYLESAKKRQEKTEYPI